MYVILTSKPAQYLTYANADIEMLEAWDYLFYGHLQAKFVIGRLRQETRVQVVETTDSRVVNWVPSKFLERFDTLEQAQQELQSLCNFGSLDARLVAAQLPSLTSPGAA